MKTKDKLTNILISYILGNLGLTPSILFGKFGISEEYFKSNEVVKFTYNDDNQFSFPVYSASTLINEDKLHVVFVCFNEDGGKEIYLVLNFSDGTTFFIKEQSVEDDNGLFLEYKDGAWNNVSMYRRLMVGAGIIKIVDDGFVWAPEEPDKLYKVLLEAVQLD
jgi:hypothetical protein